MTVTKMKVWLHDAEGGLTGQAEYKREGTAEPEGFMVDGKMYVRHRSGQYRETEVLEGKLLKEIEPEPEKDPEPEPALMAEPAPVKENTITVENVEPEGAPKKH